MSDTNESKGVEKEIAKQELISLMSSLREQLAGHLFLDKVKNGELSIEQWKAFAVQRYLAANNFEALLEAAIYAANESGDQNLASTLQSNLNDEIGVNNDGSIDPDMAHSKWRENFYGAIGVDEEQMQTKPLDSTKTYAEEVERLSNEDLLKMVGAILFLEFSIPKEFGKLREGRDKTFPEKFVDVSGDNEATLETKGRARLYLDDHIVHDAQSHYPNLLNAIKPYLADSKKIAKIKEGIIRIVEAKKVFYDGLEKI